MNEKQPLNIFPDEDRGQIVKFLELLATVDCRVSSTNTTSTLGAEGVDHGFIDKLTLKLSEDVSLCEILAISKRTSIKAEGKYLGDKRFYIVLESESGTKVWNHLLHRDNESFNTITVNPSKFRNLKDLEDFLYNIYGARVSAATIKRIDLSVDIYDCFNQVIKGLDVLYKSVKTEYSNKTSFTGLMIGKGEDKLLIYDKSVESKTKAPRTRLERQFSGKKVPIKKFGELRKYIQNLDQDNSMNIFSLNYIEFVRPKVRLTSIQEGQLQELQSLINHFGFYQTRKKLNQNRNFLRDYSGYFLLIPFKKQPNHLFNEGMKAFITEESENGRNK